MTITGDYQLEYKGLKVGDTTPYDLLDIEGLAGMPNVRSADIELIGRDGLHAGVDRLGGRFVELAFEIDGVTNIDAFATAFSAPDPEGDALEESPLSFQIPGVAGGGIRRILCRPRAVAAPIGLQRALGDLSEVIVSLAATDPRIYDETQSSDSIGLPSSTGGLTWPLTWPLTWGTSSSSILTVTNSGNFRTGCQLRIDGPCTDPKITSLTRDRILQLDLVIASGSWVIIDTDKRTVIENGTTNRFNTITAASEWWSLAPGANSLQFNAAAGTGATLTVTHRSAWIF